MVREDIVLITFHVEYEGVFAHGPREAPLSWLLSQADLRISDSGAKDKERPVWIKHVGWLCPHPQK